MCRYETGMYKPHYACFNCRKTFKRRLLKDINRDAPYSDDLGVPHTCPECGSLTIDMGLDFKSPKRKDTRAWQHIESLYKVDVTFHSCGCMGPGYIPKNTEELISFLKEKKELYLKNLRFWLCYEMPMFEKEYLKNQGRLTRFMTYLPPGLRKKNKDDKRIFLMDAVDFWKLRLMKISSKISELT